MLPAGRGLDVYAIRRDVRLLVSLTYNSPRTATKTALTTTGIHNCTVYLETRRNPLRWACIRARRPYASPPKKQTCRIRCMA